MKWSERGAVPAARTVELTDESQFPFGKHGPKGDDPRVMRDVPASYLDWLDGQAWIGEWPAVKAYIDRNRKAINQDLERESRSRTRSRYDSRCNDGYQFDPDDDVPY